MKMKKYTLIMVIGSLLSAIIIVGCSLKKFNNHKPAYAAVKSQEAYARGEILVYSICAGCHYDHAANKFIGTRIHEIPGIIGKVYSANLTHSKEHGIPPRYTDGELKYLFRTGISKDGRFLNYMLRPNMSDDDINAIIVFLRSDAPAMAPADTTIGITHFNWLGKTIMNNMARPATFKDGIRQPSESDPVATGRYLVDNLGCFHCHSKSLTSLNLVNPEQTPEYMQGGQKFETPTGVKIYASNLTPDKQTGIGNYTQVQFRKALKEGETPNGKLHPPMPRLDKLKDEDADAIYAYLRTIQPVVHKVQGH
jgi:cytochrome c553